MASLKGNNIHEIDDDTLDMELDGINGTLRVKPLGITNAQVAADAAIAESKLNIATKSIFDLNGLTPTASGDWAMAPTNLANFTDNDPDTEAIEGQVNGGNTAYINIDLGVLTKCMIWVDYRHNRGSSYSTFSTVTLQTSPDNLTWTNVTNYATNSDCTVERKFQGYFTTNIRYIRLKHSVNVANGYLTAQRFLIVAFH